VLKLQGSVARATWAASPIAALLFAVCSPAQGAPNADYRVKDLEAELRATQARVVELQATLDTLAAGVAALKGESGSRQNTELKPPEQREPSAGGESIEGELRDAMLVPDLGRDERGNKLEAKPQLFVQTGFAAGRIEGATRDDAATNFTLTRLEARWAGQVTEQLGMGFEIQYGPAPEGASEELVNDAFVEYYANDAVTLRLGQFVIPFGFDPQQSTSERESPERAMFVGYFFPGERDRGAMVAADLSSLGGWLEGMDLYGGVFNGNRFFDDDNNDLNVNLRVRKLFSDMPFAIGLSLQTGKQVVPPDAINSARATVYGIDAQWALGRLGIRAEYVRGDMPSKLLGLEPEFVAGYEPGAKTSGADAFFDYRLTLKDEVYWRWDWLGNDPVTRADVRAFNAGYLRRLGKSSHIGFDYQWKNGVTSNDDKVNTRFAIRWSLVY